MKEKLYSPFHACEMTIIKSRPVMILINHLEALKKSLSNQEKCQA